MANLRFLPTKPLARILGGSITLSKQIPLNRIRVQHYQNDMEYYYQNDLLKEQTYEPDFAINSPRSREELSINI